MNNNSAIENYTNNGVFPPKDSQISYALLKSISTSNRISASPKTFNTNHKFKKELKMSPL